MEKPKQENQTTAKIAVPPIERKKPGRKKKEKTPIKFHITHETVVLSFN